MKLMTLDPGHFHAALVHKKMYPQVDSTIYLFAPEGPEVNDFLSKIEPITLVLKLLPNGRPKASLEMII